MNELDMGPGEEMGDRDIVAVARDLGLKTGHTCSKITTTVKNKNMQLHECHK